MVLQHGETAHSMKHLNNGFLAVVLGLLLNFLAVIITMNRGKKNKAVLHGVADTMAIAGLIVNKGETKKIYSPRKYNGGGSSDGCISGGSSSHGF